MESPDLLALFVAPLEKLGLPYMVTGGVAVVLYGDPRFTRDIDIVLSLRAEDAERLVSAFESADFYVPPLETLIEEAGRSKGGHFNIIHRDTGLRADVYLLDAEPLHRWGFERRSRLKLAGGAVSLAPMANVVLRKLQYYRASRSDRHLRDVSSMIRISPEELDQNELRGWVEELGPEEQWTAAREFEQG